MLASNEVTPLFLSFAQSIYSGKFALITFALLFIALIFSTLSAKAQRYFICLSVANMIIFSYLYIKLVPCQISLLEVVFNYTRL
nr:MAG TPA: hypothetical protein [Caudoviricetes sp.]